MSRLVSVFNRDGCPVEVPLLRQMIHPLRHCAVDGPSFWTQGAAGLAYQCLRDSSHHDDLQPVEGAGNVALCFDGRLDNREELSGILAADLSGQLADLSDASLVLACYRRFGESFATHLNGDFSLALFDAAAQRLLLARDPMGIRPLYFWVSPRVFLAASEIKAILAHPGVEVRPDQLTIADVLVGGDPHELRRTFFHHVRRALPGHTVIVTRDRIREFRHWDFDVTRQVRCASLAEYAEALRAVFQQAVRRRLRSAARAAVTVSGGVDSSAIICQAEQLRQSGLPVAAPAAISMVFPDGSAADEKRYLDEIEKHYRIEIRRLHFSAFHYVDDEKWLGQVEYPRVCWNSEFEIYRTARELGCTALLDGYYGDQMMASFANLFALARSFRWRQASREFDTLAQWLTDSPPHLLRRELVHIFLRDLAPDWLMRPFRSLRRLHDSDMYPRWYAKPLRQIAYQRCQQQRRPALPFASKHAEICYRYFLAPHRLDCVEQFNKIAASFGMDKSYPFMDRDLVAFIMSVPADVMNWRGVYKGLFREAMRGTLPEPT
ncbi:MAG: asparagine synthetase B family protein, partial [Terriglobales bacterium]